MNNGTKCVQCSEKDTLNRIEATLERIDSSINGNGQLGIKLRVHDLEQHMKRTGERRKEEHAKRWSIYLLLLSNALLIVRMLFV